MLTGLLWLGWLAACSEMPGAPLAKFYGERLAARRPAVAAVGCLAAGPCGQGVVGGLAPQNGRKAIGSYN